MSELPDEHGSQMDLTQSLDIEIPVVALIIPASICVYAGRSSLSNARVCSWQLFARVCCIAIYTIHIPRACRATLRKTPRYILLCLVSLQSASSPIQWE
jgi:hypothetical protein